MKFRGVRGATTVEQDSADAILTATRELLELLIEANSLTEDDIASIIFTTTPDLRATYPAKAARELGWTQVALMGCQEMDVPGGVARCIRVLIHWNTIKANHELRHIFLRRATALRPDLSPTANANGRTD
ncbi:MAG: chorismate mutase [Chloroflexota bacterium]|nr:chorismate mutase [Chloroflexota bacterium]